MNFRAAGKVLVAGFAIFSFIFGSGNVVFPLVLGNAAGSSMMYSIFGWTLSTTLIPLLGFFGSFLFDGDNKKYMAPLGKYVSFGLMLIIMLLVGPTGVTPRGVNVAYGAFYVVNPGMNETLFNFVFCAITLWLAWNPAKIVEIIGKVFTPIKLGGIALIALMALVLGPKLIDIPASAFEVKDIFSNSFKTGFQTMDLLAAFLTASMIFKYLRNAVKEIGLSEKSIFKFSAASCIVGGVALAAVYAGLIIVGAQYSLLLDGVPDTSLLSRVAEISMGGAALWSVATIISVSCLATNIALTSVFTEFVHTDILRGRGNKKTILVIVSAITFGSSLLGFEKLCGLLGAVLEYLYPLLIVFVVMRIIYFYAMARKQ